MGAVRTGNAYDKYGTTNPVERRLMRGFFAALDASLPADAPATVLDVGTGEGEVSDHVRRRYPTASVVGADLPDLALAAEWRRRDLAGAFADIVRLPFPTGAFDLVLAVEVLEHVPDPDAALLELSRLCAAHLVVSVPREPIWRVANVARGKYLGALGNTPGHIQHWSTRRFASLVDTRFDLTSVRRPFPWTMVAATPRPPSAGPAARPVRPVGNDAEASNRTGPRAGAGSGAGPRRVAGTANRTRGTSVRERIPAAVAETSRSQPAT